jgi:hypothetical protein
VPTQSCPPKRPRGPDSHASPHPKRQLPATLREPESDDIKAPQGPLRKYQDDESSDSYESTSSESLSPKKPDPADDILLAGVRILQNGLKSSTSKDPQVDAPTEHALEKPPPPSGDLVTEEADYTVDEDIRPLDLGTETNREGEQVSCPPS